MNRRVWILAAVFALLPAGAFADDLHYTYVQSGWVNVDPDFGESGSGPAVDVSYGLSDFVHLVGLYNDVEFDPIETTTWGIGAGVHQSLREGLDVFGEASYIEADIDVPFIGNFSEDGYQVCAGLRAMVMDSLEVNGGLEYVDLGPGDDTALVVNALWSVNQRFSFGGGYSLGDDANTLSLGFRINFGQR